MERPLFARRLGRVVRALIANPVLHEKPYAFWPWQSRRSFAFLGAHQHSARQESRSDPFEVAAVPLQISMDDGLADAPDRPEELTRSASASAR